MSGNWSGSQPQGLRAGSSPRQVRVLLPQAGRIYGHKVTAVSPLCLRCSSESPLKVYLRVCILGWPKSSFKTQTSVYRYQPNIYRYNTYNIYRYLSSFYLCLITTFEEASSLPHFADGETEALSNKVSSSRSHKCCVTLFQELPVFILPWHCPSRDSVFLPIRWVSYTDFGHPSQVSSTWKVGAGDWNLTCVDQPTRPRVSCWKSELGAVSWEEGLFGLVDISEGCGPHWCSGRAQPSPPGTKIRIPRLLAGPPLVFGRLHFVPPAAGGARSSSHSQMTVCARSPLTHSGLH